MDSQIICTKNELLDFKNFYLEVRSQKDINNFIHNGIILLDVLETNVKNLLENTIKKMIGDDFKVHDYDNILKNVVLTDRIPILKNSIQWLDQNENQNDYLNQRWLISYFNLSFINKTKIAMVRLKNEIYFNPSSKYVKMLILVLTPTYENHTKNGLEVGRTFASLLANENLRRKLLEAKNSEDFISYIKYSSSEQKKKNFELTLFDSKNFNLKDQVPSFKFSVLKGLKNDMNTIVKFYKSDFTDIFKDRKSQLKAISTTVFLYFTCILPTIAFGSVNDKNTSGLIDAQKALIGQVVGGLIFAFFSGQPLTIVATTAPLCLYTKIIMDISNSLSVDFFSMFAWVGIFNFLFLVIYSTLDLSQLMKFSTSGIENIFSTFIFFAFSLDALHDINHLFKTNYFNYINQSHNFFMDSTLVNSTNSSIVNLEKINNTIIDKATNLTNDKDCPILAIFLMLMTFWLANNLHRLNQTTYLTKFIRELLSDYSLPISIIFFSIISNTVFKNTQKDEFKFNNSFAFQIANLINVNNKCILISLGLGFSLSLLFFMDQNISAALVQKKENNLKKPNSYDWDLLLIGFINLILAIFGFPFMHGILPHSPLHAKNLAEIEYTVENGLIKENVLFVRETRVTAIFSHILIGLSLLMIPYPINLIPISVLDGLFLFCAFSTLNNNSFFDRLVLFITEPGSYPKKEYISKCSKTVLHKFTFIQLIQLIIVCLFGFAPWPSLEMSFPIIIALLIPFRKFVLPKIFTKKDLNVLDPYEN